jgi:hypothetical protein|eukprot:COSAG01_NODE_274_length_19734_cov_122.033512_8_plen_69_part_00
MSLYTLLRCSNVVCDILDQTAATRYKPQACYGYMYKVKRKPYKVGGRVDDVSQLMRTARRIHVTGREV